MDIKKIVIAGALFFIAATAAAKQAAYESLLKKWTRDAQVYVWDNFEARLVWHATYLSPDYRAARREKLSELYEWPDAELSKKIREDSEAERANDEFILVIYSGSSAWSEVGKDDGKWRIVLEQDGSNPVEAVGLEQIPVTQVERELYPFLDKWSHLYLARFPKILRGGGPFRLRMTGIPAKSQLVWQ